MEYEKTPIIIGVGGKVRIEVEGDEFFASRGIKHVHVVKGEVEVLFPSFTVKVTDSEIKILSLNEKVLKEIKVVKELEGFEDIDDIEF